MSESTDQQESQQTDTEKKSRAPKGSRVVASVTAGDGAVKVDIKKRTDGRGWLYYAEYRRPDTGKRRRPSLQTDDLEQAKENAKEIAKELAVVAGAASEEELAEVKQSRIELGQVFDAYRRKRMPHFVKDGVPNGHWINLDRVIRVAEVVWGRDQLVSELGSTEVEEFKVRRAEGGFEIEGRRLPDQYDRLIIPAEPTLLGPCSPRTVRGELGLLSVIFNWATEDKVKGGEGRELIAANPLKGISLKAGQEVPRQPVLTEKRYRTMLQYAPEVEAITRGEVEYQRHMKDGRVVYQRNPRGRRGKRYKRMPEGFLTTLLMLARGTARRLSALRHVRVGDVLLTRNRMREKLLDLGWPEDWADAWPYGAMYWNPKYDKEGYSRVTPLSKRLHDQLRTYLAELGTIDPEAWLFHSASSREKPPSSQQMWRWFRRIERVARYHGEDLPRLKWGAWHPARRQWRSERAGFFDDKLIALVGGWREFKNAHEAMNQGYLQYHPRALYLCAEFDPRRDVPEDGRVPGVKVKVHAPDAQDPRSNSRTG